MKLDQQICSQLYNQLYSDLVKVASVYGIKKVGLRKYFVPEGDNTSRYILIRLCSSLQNSGQMARSIKFNDDKSDNGKIIEQVLCGFDIEEAKKYRSWEEIYDKLKAKGITDNGAEKRKARKQEADKANKKKKRKPIGKNMPRVCSMVSFFSPVLLIVA